MQRSSPSPAPNTGDRRILAVEDDPDLLRLIRRELEAAGFEVWPAASGEEALALANDSEYGLTGAVYSRSISRGLALAQRFRSGMVHVNDQTVGDEPQMPFGGVKDSGWGRFGGRAAVEEFTELRWVTGQAGTRHFPF